MCLRTFIIHLRVNMTSERQLLGWVWVTKELRHLSNHENQCYGSFWSASGSSDPFREITYQNLTPESGSGLKFKKNFFLIFSLKILFSINFFDIYVSCTCILIKKVICKKRKLDILVIFVDLNGNCPRFLYPAPYPDLFHEVMLRIWIRILPNETDPSGSGSGSTTLMKIISTPIENTLVDYLYLQYIFSLLNKYIHKYINKYLSWEKYILP